MRVHLKIQWGYTFFLTWHCKTNYFKYKLCLVYNYMESYLFMLLWSTRNPSECPLLFFFLLKRVGAGGTAKFQLRPLKVITCYLFLLHHNPTSCLLLSLHVLCCLYFSFFGQMMWWLWGVCSIQQPLKTCGTHKTVSNLWGSDTWKPHKHTQSGLIFFGERRPFLFWFDMYGAGFDRRHTSKKKCGTLKVIKELSVQCCGFMFFFFISEQSLSNTRYFLD